MGSSVYGARTLVAVKPNGKVNFLYGFYTNMDATERVALGHQAALVAGNYINGLVIGANAPKPSRVQRYRTGGGYDTSFVSSDKLDEARAAGWKVTRKSSYRGAAPTTRSKPVYIKIGELDETGAETGPQIKYAWRMRADLYAAITAGDKTALGILDVTKADWPELAWGVRYPSPPRVIFTAIAADKSISSRSTFCDPKKLDALPTGWAPAKTSGYV